ncbi:MAG: alkaline phosphatase family protein [Oscillospiraceae bacterium]|nr:alkaline phosphatase family protein [Oscillospiraceae bacterium]
MKKNVFLPDYKNSILGIPNSILSHYGAETHHPTLSVLDESLRKGHKNVVLLVLDGMGLNVLEAHAPGGFFMKNLAARLCSVCPCTTTSALTTFETGLTPIEHGWLGWSNYFEEIGKCVDIFSGKESGTDRPAADYNIVGETIGFKNLFEQIKEADPSVECCRVSPFGEYKSGTNEEICAHIETLCKKDGRRYIYCYHFQPDRDMHDYGCYSERVKADIALFDKQIEQLAANLADALLIITADHGLTDVNLFCIEDYPEIAECLAAHPAREPRNLSFLVKDGQKERFSFLWQKQFGDKFIFMTGEEAYESGYFGKGLLHSRSRGFLGDFAAFATGDIGLWYRNEKGESHDYKALHAGLCEEEMVVPLILIER